jgi:hypothetical protein
MLIAKNSAAVAAGGVDAGVELAILSAVDDGIGPNPRPFRSRPALLFPRWTAERT